MAVIVRNHVQPFRPLRGGIAIMNGNNGPSGTLGCVATSDGQDRWILSAFHVMQGAADDLADNEPIFQPALGGSAQPVARTKRNRADRALDIAAAEVVSTVATVNEILGIGSVGSLLEPVEGMLVVKSGIATGVTEGVITLVQGHRVRIEMRPGYPSKYELSAISDSGSVWLAQSTAQPVALHVAGTDTGIEIAMGVRMSEVLRVLGLSLLS
jgi:hypothetical protein